MLEIAKEYKCSEIAIAKRVQCSEIADSLSQIMNLYIVFNCDAAVTVAELIVTLSKLSVKLYALM